MNKDRWSRFGNPTCRLQDLGRTATFTLPMRALQQEYHRGTVEAAFGRFLGAHFAAHTVTTIPGFDVQKDPTHEITLEEARRYDVSLKGNNRMHLLIKELTRIAKLTGEECVRIEKGQPSCLVVPR